MGGVGGGGGGGGCRRSMTTKSWQSQESGAHGSGLARGVAGTPVVQTVTTQDGSGPR